MKRFIHAIAALISALLPIIKLFINSMTPLDPTANIRRLLATASCVNIYQISNLLPLTKVSI